MLFIIIIILTLGCVKNITFITWRSVLLLKENKGNNRVSLCETNPPHEIIPDFTQWMSRLKQILKNEYITQIVVAKYLDITFFYNVFSGWIMLLKKFNQYTWLYSAYILFIQHYIILAGVYKLNVEHYLTYQNNINRTTVQYFDRAQSTVPAGFPIFKFQFCLRHHTNITLNQICGYSDNKLIHLDIIIGNRTITSAAISNYKRGMHKSFCMSIHLQIHLDPGIHYITLKRNSDITGTFSVDTITVDIPDKYLTADILQCSKRCSEHIDIPKYYTHEVKTLVKGTIKNYSYQTNCAEVDNINIPLFHPHARKIKITALHPSYKTTENLKHHDFENCKQNELELFRLNNFRIGQKFTIRDRFVITEGRYLNRRTILLQFVLEGPMNDAVDSEIGCDIILLISPITPNTEILFSYFGRLSRWIGTTPVKFDMGHLMHKWSVPDFTWSAVATNYISLILPENYNTDLVVDSLLMVRRPIQQDVPFSMFHDKRVLIEGVNKDFWWLNTNGQMTIKIIETNQTFSIAEYVRIYVQIPRDNWCQIFVLYQDGNVRLLPKTPPRFDWIPFGSSILVGETNQEFRRPQAPIRHIDIYTKTLRFDMTYYDGNTVSLTVNSGVFDTSLTLNNIQFHKQRRLPILTFRSMYVSEGNADCDHVNVDGKYHFNIISNWSEISGNAFFFYRKCISKHNTQSPDYLVQYFQ